VLDHHKNQLQVEYPPPVQQPPKVNIFIRYNYLRVKIKYIKLNSTKYDHDSMSVREEGNMSQIIILQSRKGKHEPNHYLTVPNNT
jgi:hypothetical protein